MKETPIPFTGPMVRAILEDRKTQTRRVIKPQPHESIDRLHNNELRKRFPYPLEDDNGNPCGMGFQDADNRFWVCPYGQPGDRLWVKERFALHKDSDRLSPKNAPKDCRFYFDEHGRQTGTNPRIGRWRSSRFMPRWHSRIDLEITAVRVERVQDMEGAPEDALAEGIHSIPHGMNGTYYHAFRTDPDPKNWSCPVDAYRELWDSINAKRGYGWDVNPWVWVIEFKRL